MTKGVEEKPCKTKQELEEIYDRIKVHVKIAEILINDLRSLIEESKGETYNGISESET